MRKDASLLDFFCPVARKIPLLTPQESGRHNFSQVGTYLYRRATTYVNIQARERRHLSSSADIRPLKRSLPRKSASNMAQFFQSPPPNQPQYGAQSAQNLQFYPSSYTPGPVSGHATPSQASYGYGQPAGSPGYGPGGFNSGFGAPVGGVSGRMGEQGGLRTGWLAAFGTEGYDGEPPLLEELGVNFSHIQSKVCALSPSHSCVGTLETPTKTLTS